MSLKIIAGTLRGRSLAAPAGDSTRPTAQRMRQALFDMLMHAPWAEGRIVGARVLDAFAGTGALGLEALSRGAASCVFIELDRFALAALRANIAACRMEAACRVVPGDALRPKHGTGCDLVFLDPPYGAGLVPLAVTALAAVGWLAPGALLVVETGRDEALTLPGERLAERAHGAALVTVWRAAQ
jgi:16S rRNA (guanine966-N2)-methyltransferase